MQILSIADKLLTAKTRYATSFVALLALMVVGVAHADDEQLQKVRGGKFVYEQTFARIVETDDQGGGVIELFWPDCENCEVSRYTFDSGTFFYTPLGKYRGLEKFSTWADRSMSVSVRKDSGRAVSLGVHSR